MSSTGDIKNLSTEGAEVNVRAVAQDRFMKRVDFRTVGAKTSDMLKKTDYELKPKITVFGVGGAGGNAVNNMIATNVEGCDFVVANTDAQAITQSIAEKRIQLGITITRGLGAGSRPDVGRAAAEEAKEEIQEYLYGSNMVFITAGMGGGTGTGAAPIIAKLAKEQGILTIGVVTKPFHFEGTHRMRIAEKGIAELQKFVDTLLIIPNQNLFRIANEKTTFADAFKLADNVLSSGVRGVTDLMIMPGLINLDFADIRSVMSEMGKAMMGTGDAEGERKAILAAEAAISNPLLDDVSMKGAKGVLINITGGYDMTLYEVDEAANRIRDEVDPEANIIFGSTFDATMEGRMRVSVVATGIDANKEDVNARVAHLKHLFGHESLAGDTQSVLNEAEDRNVINTSSQYAATQKKSDDEITDNGSSPQSLRDSMKVITNESDVVEKLKSYTVNDAVDNIVEKKSFFDRIVGLMSSGSKKASMDQKRKTFEKSVVGDTVKPSNLSANNQELSEEEIEIPAFLRRK